MSNHPAAHPKTDHLIAFGLGKLDPVEATEIAEHLDRCRECSETMVCLQDDTFVGLVRRSPAPLPAARTEDSPSPAEQPQRPEVTVDVASGPTRTCLDPAELPSELREHPRYEIAELIGRGGMGDVYKAQHKLMNRPVALKVINSDLVQNETAVRRFRREVQAAARLHHGNIVTAHDAEQAGSLHFLVMEFVDGVNLDEIVRQRGALPVDLACNYIRQAAAGLQHAHELGMVHRDIKPHNLMVASSGDLKILDFGLAGFATEVAEDRLRAEVPADLARPVSALHHLTQMGTMMGTPDYIAPEQARDAHAADIRADIYSLGCTFYALLAGKAPFGEGSVLEKVKAHAEREARPISELRDDATPEVEAILRKMMAKDPADRFQTPAEVAVALERLPRGVLAPVEKPALTPAAAARRTRRPVVVLTAVAGLFLAIAAGVVIYLATDTGRLEINSEKVDIPGAKIVLTKDGQEYAQFDVEPSTKMQRIWAGNYEVFLRGAPQGMDLKVWSTRPGKPHDFGAPYDPKGKVVAVYRGGGMHIEIAQSVQAVAQPQRGSPSAKQLPLVIGMNDEFGMLFQGRLVAPAELSRRLREALAENPDHTVSIDLPKKPWTVAEHVDQLEQIARITGAKHITRPAWAETAQPQRDDRVIKEIHRLQGHTGSIERLTFIDDTRFVSAGLTGEEYVWDARQGKRVQTLTEPDRLLTAVVAAPAAGLFATGNSYGQLRLWNKDLTTTGTIKGPETICVTLAMSADGSLLMSSGMTPQLPHIWNTRTQELVRTLDSKSGLIMAAAFTPDGKRLVTGGMAKHLSVWNVATGELLSTIELGIEVRTLSLSPDGRLAAVASSDPVVIVDLQTKEVTHRFNGHTLRVQTVAFLPDGRHVVSGSQDKTWRVWSLADSREVARVTDPTPHTQQLAVSPDGKLVVGGGGEPYDQAAKSFPKDGDYDLRVWELPESLWPIQGASANRIVVELSVDGQFRLAGRPLNPAELVKQLQLLLKENPQREVHVLPAEPFRGFPFRALVHVVRSAGAKNVTWPAGLSDQPEPVRKFVGHTNMVKSVAFSPDGKLIASASGFPLGDNTVRIWDRDSGAVLHELDLHRIPVVFVAFSPDGQRLLSGDSQGQFMLWDPQSGRRLKNWRNDGIMIDEVAFTPDGKQIVFLKNDASAANAAVQELEKTPPNKIDPEALKLRMESLTKRTIQVVNAADGTLVKSIPLDAVASPGVAVTPDGRHVVVPMYDGTVRMLELATGKEARRFSAPETDPPTQPVMAFATAVSPNGEKLAAGYLNRTVRVWNLNTGEMLREIRTNSSAGRVVFFADNRRLAVSGPVLQEAPYRTAASVLDSESGAVLAMTPAIGNRAVGDGFAFALAPDQQHILTAGGGYYDNQSRQWKGTGDYALRLWKLSDLGEIDTNKLPSMPEPIKPPMPDKINLFRELPKAVLLATNVPTWIVAIGLTVGGLRLIK